MESEFSPDQGKSVPTVPIKTYQWEDLRRAREAGGYPWTHLLKVPLEGEITAEDIIRETTPRRSMSREVSRSRTRSPVSRGSVDGDMQRILNLDSSPGSSRRHGEEGEDEGVQIPNFSKEVSLDAEDDPDLDVNTNAKRPASQASASLVVTPVEIPKNISPKGILKRRVPEQQYNIGVTETREKTKCCHPLVNKIKHLADKTLHKLERNENEKSPLSKRKKNEDNQEIRQLKSSPGAVRRQKFSAIKLGDSDEMSKTMCVDTPPPRKKKEHIYEDIEGQEQEKNLHFSPPEVEESRQYIEDDSRSNSNKENESLSNIEKKSIASQDPSLVTEETPLKSEDHVMEKLHKMDNINKEAVLLDMEMDPEEPNVDEIFQNQLDERSLQTSCHKGNESPNITITEITEEDAEGHDDQPHAPPIESSPSPSPRDIELAKSQWSKPSSDHEYEIIEKPPPNIVYTAPSVDEKPAMVKTDDELSSTTSLERKYLQHTSDEEEPIGDKEHHNENEEDILSAEALQKNIEDRFFANTPSTVSRTECEVSTSQVDSSALEHLPLKRDNRTKNMEGTESKIQKRIKEGTGKLKTQAGKLKTKLQNIKATMPDRPKISLPDRSKFKMPERPKISMPDRPKFTMPNRRKFSLPDRPKFKKINISEKLSFGDRKKFTLPERPKFNVPDMPKFKMPERPKINFPSLGRKNKVTNQENTVETNATGSSAELENVATVDFESRTYPRWFSKKKKSEIPKTSSSPTLNREDTPPPTFTFTRVSKKSHEEPSSYIPDSPEEPREYGNASTRTASNDDVNYDNGNNVERRKQYETTYDFDKIPPEFMDENQESDDNCPNSSDPEISPPKQDHTPVITEINNDEFFVRPRGISREDIQVREYLSDETRQAFQTPKNVLALMGSSSEMNDDIMYMNDPEADPEFIDENEHMRYSTEDLNDKDDGYYTFPPVRPSRAKRKKKPLPEPEQDPTPYIDNSAEPSIHFTDVDLGMQDPIHEDGGPHESMEFVNGDSHMLFTPTSDLHSIHEYANDDVIQYPENVPIQSQTLPMPPKRKKKFGKKDLHSSLSSFSRPPLEEYWEEPRVHEHVDDIIVYRTEHEYIVPRGEVAPAQDGQASPVPPRRARSRTSRTTSLCDDDRTSHGADSLTMDSHIPTTELGSHRDIRHESPGYATVDKGPYLPSKGVRRSISKTPPARRRKSNSSERKYYTVGSTKNSMPDRPPRKKSSTSLMTLDSFTKHSDTTQYVEIEDEPVEEVHKDLQSGDIVNKMKDRPLPPPPRPPRGSRKSKKDKSLDSDTAHDDTTIKISQACPQEPTRSEDVVEIEVSTQTDPLPDDIEFELGLDENLDVSMSSSLRDIVEDESIFARSHSRIDDSPHVSRPTSRSDKSGRFTNPKTAELSKPNIGRSSPTVILVERRVSSPTRINERQEMLTEASLTVQHIDIDEVQIPDVPPLPRPRGISSTAQSSKNMVPSSEERALERMTDASRDVHLDNLVTQRLQVRDLDVGRLNVAELQANKILVSDIEGMTLQVSELDSKSGHISVSGIEFSQNVIDEIVKKFAEISTSVAPPQPSPVPPTPVGLPAQEALKPVSMEEETQTELNEIKVEPVKAEPAQVLGSSPDQVPASPPVPKVEETKPTYPPPVPESPATSAPPADEGAVPQRPPPPDLTPLLYSYLQDITIPPAQFYTPRQFREAKITEFHEHQSPPPPARRLKRKPVAHQSESSSEEARIRPSPRRMPAPVRAHEPTIVEAGAQFLRVCHTSISRTLRNMFNVFMSYISGTEDKRDVQMALVIFLVLVAGLIMFGLSDSRAIHHHHWEFFNPPDGNE